MPKPSTWIIGGLTFLANAGLYLAFTSNVDAREAVAAVPVAAVATVAVLVVAHAGKVSFRFRPRDVAQAWRMPWYALTGTGEVLKGLAMQLFTSGGAPSFLAAVPFDVGEKDDVADAGRRALAVTYTTATPNFVVLGVIEEQRLMLYHQIVPGDVIAVTRKLGARP